MKKEKYSVPAIDHAVSIFEYLSKDHMEGKTLKEISESVGLNRSTCFRILQSLQKYNFVSYNSRQKTYKLGHYLSFLGSKASRSLLDIKFMQPFLEKATQLTNQTCVISQRFSNNQIVYVAKQESSSALRINVEIGQRRPITSTAAGKCFLAYLEREEIEDIIDSCGGLQAYTPHTIVDKEEFLENLAMSKKRGYALSLQECLLGINGVAAPIFDANNQVCYTLFLSCLSAQNDEEKLHAYGSVLKQISEQITRESSNHGI